MLSWIVHTSLRFRFLVVGIARDMAKKNDMLATPPQRIGAPPAARPISDSRGRGK